MYECSWPWGCFQKRVLKSGHQLRITNSSYAMNQTAFSNNSMFVQHGHQVRSTSTLYSALSRVQTHSQKHSNRERCDPQHTSTAAPQTHAEPPFRDSCCQCLHSRILCHALQDTCWAQHTYNHTECCYGQVVMSYI